MYSEMKKEKSVLLRQVVSTYACGELDETQQLAQSVVADGIKCVIEITAPSSPCIVVMLSR